MSEKNTRANISVGDIRIELEGGENFVLSQLAKYHAILFENNSVQKKAASGSMPIRAMEPRKDGLDTSVPSKQEDKKAKPTKAAKISVERFDIHGSKDIPSLQDFVKEKKPGRSNAEKIAAIGYYISEIMGAEKFTEGQIEYAYKMLKYNRPTYLHQIMINTKNDKDWFEPLEEHGEWALTRSGDIFVADELPKSEDA